MRHLAATLLIVAATSLTHAATFTSSLPNGTLVASPSTGLERPTVLGALPSPVPLSNAPVTVSAELDPSLGGVGGLNIGIVLDDVYFLFHPGFAGHNFAPAGSFRFEDLAGNDLIVNQPMGFTPNADSYRVRVALSASNATHALAAVTIEGASASNAGQLFQGAYPVPLVEFDSPGFVTRFGVSMTNPANHPDASPARSLAYRNLSATWVPEPTISTLLVAALIGGFRRRRRG